MDTALLLIDVQPLFLESMHGDQEPLLLRLERLLKFADMVSMPVVATVERPLEEKGALPDRDFASLTQCTTRKPSPSISTSGPIAAPPVDSAPVI